MSASSSASSGSGDAKGLSGSGNKVFNVGGNPNLGILSGSPMLVIAMAAVLVFFLWKRK
jgi:hypothetical protein